MSGAGNTLNGAMLSSFSASTLGRLRTRDPAAWNRLSVVFAPLIYRWALRAGLRSEDAKDVVQEVFKTVLMRISDFRRDRPGDTFRGWLAAITHNKLGEHFRRSRKMPQAVGGSDAFRSLEQVEEVLDFDLDPDCGLRSLSERVISFIRSEFRDDHWKAFLRIVIKGDTTEEVALDLKMSVNAVYLAKSRILCRLRQELGDLDE
jgi:RNA polymerase sigma-70 factor (ECF subfamily)